MKLCFNYRDGKGKRGSQKRKKNKIVFEVRKLFCNGGGGGGEGAWRNNRFIFYFEEASSKLDQDFLWV